MKLQLSQWAEQELRLPEGGAVPGKLRLYGYQKAIADAISDETLTRVSVLKSARIGYTTLLNAAIANYVKNDPGNILAVLPTEEACSRFVVSEIEPLFAASPCLKNAFKAPRGKASRNRMMYKKFAGGELRIVPALSPRNLASHTSKILILDEVDRMGPTGEGSPIELAITRTLTFKQRKILMGSTPVDTDTSHIIAAYAESDQRVFEVPCPGCGTFGEIFWKDIKWPKGQPEAAYWCAPCCGTIVEESQKLEITEAGRWRITKPEVKGHAGFKINCLVSPIANARWCDAAETFLKCEKDPTRLKTFVNTWLGEGWDRFEGTEIDEHALYARREKFGLQALPEEVVTITCGVDVQHTWLEVVTIGWTRKGVPLVLDHRRIEGRYDDNLTWLELDEFLKSRWQHPFGAMLGIEAAAVDTSDGVTQNAGYAFCFPRARRRILAIKGASGFSRSWIMPSIQKTRGGVLWLVGVDSIKAALFELLRVGDAFRFSEDLGLIYFEQLCGERMATRTKAGRAHHVFEEVAGRRHECLDATVYAMAAHRGLNIDYDRRESDLRQEPKPINKPAPAMNYITGEAA